MGEIKFMQGNEAITEGAIAAGARFYAGYPITPSSEVATSASVRLPQVGGMFVQMEDEIGSIAAVIGASSAGKKSYTATSGPGFSLMQENLGVAIMGEVPCVIVNVQRSGPSTGLATKPAQGDVMQSRWGTHGDHGIIVITPASVQECFDLTVTAFNYSEKYRTPVILLADEVIGHLCEQTEIRNSDELLIVPRNEPTILPEEYRPYDHSEGEAPLAIFGSKYIFKINGSMHDEWGRPCNKPDNANRVVQHLTDKIEKKQEELALTKGYMLDDAEYAIIAYGASTRSALGAMKIARENDIKVGVLQLITLWPTPEIAIRNLMERVKAAIVPEMNLGQYIGEIQKRNPKSIAVAGVNRIDGRPIEPVEIVEKLKEVSQ